MTYDTTNASILCKFTSTRSTTGVSSTTLCSYTLWIQHILVCAVLCHWNCITICVVPFQFKPINFTTQIFDNTVVLIFIFVYHLSNNFTHLEYARIPCSNLRVPIKRFIGITTTNRILSKLGPPVQNQTFWKIIKIKIQKNSKNMITQQTKRFHSKTRAFQNNWFFTICHMPNPTITTVF